MVLYVSNLPRNITGADLKELFSSVGEVTSAKISFDRDSGRSRDFGFVEMRQEDGQRALLELSGQKTLSLPMRINEVYQNSAPIS